MRRWESTSDRSLKFPVKWYFLLSLLPVATEVSTEVFNFKFHKLSGWLWYNL